MAKTLCLPILVLFALLPLAACGGGGGDEPEPEEIRLARIPLRYAETINGELPMPSLRMAGTPDTAARPPAVELHDFGSFGNGTTQSVISSVDTFATPILQQLRDSLTDDASGRLYFFFTDGAGTGSGLGIAPEGVMERDVAPLGTSSDLAGYTITRVVVTVDQSLVIVSGMPATTQLDVSFQIEIFGHPE